MVNFFQEIAVFVGIGVGISFVGSVCVVDIGVDGILRVGIGIVGGVSVVGVGVVGIHGDGDGAASGHHGTKNNK